MCTLYAVRCVRACVCSLMSVFVCAHCSYTQHRTMNGILMKFLNYSNIHFICMITNIHLYKYIFCCVVLLYIFFKFYFVFFCFGKRRIELTQAKMLLAINDTFRFRLLFYAVLSQYSSVDVFCVFITEK